jgi:cytochrome c553
MKDIAAYFAARKIAPPAVTPDAANQHLLRAEPYCAARREALCVSREGAAQPLTDADIENVAHYLATRH